MDLDSPERSKNSQSAEVRMIHSLIGTRAGRQNCRCDVLIFVLRS